MASVQELRSAQRAFWRFAVAHSGRRKIPYLSWASDLAISRAPPGRTQLALATRHRFAVPCSSKQSSMGSGWIIRRQLGYWRHVVEEAHCPVLSTHAYVMQARGRAAGAVCGSAHQRRSNMHSERLKLELGTGCCWCLVGRWAGV